MLNTPGMSQSCPQCCASSMNNSSRKLSKVSLLHTQRTAPAFPCLLTWCQGMTLVNRGKKNLKNNDSNFFYYFFIFIFFSSDHFARAGIDTIRKTLIPHIGVWRRLDEPQWCLCTMEVGAGGTMVAGQSAQHCRPCCCPRKARQSPGERPGCCRSTLCLWQHSFPLAVL